MVAALNGFGSLKAEKYMNLIGKSVMGIDKRRNESGFDKTINW